MSETDYSLSYQAIGIVRSPFKQKFAITRQPNLVREARGEILLFKDFATTDAFRELETFSHLWLLFHFHGTAEQGWTPTVQPPRLGGKQRVGVFASRSPFRPNPIGLSALENLGVEQRDEELVLKVGGIDVLDGTPVLDIKPYIPYADSIPDATGGFAQSAPGTDQTVEFSGAAESMLASLAGRYPELRQFITAILRQDPRPAWRMKPKDEKRYGMSLYDLNIKWELQDDVAVVLSITEENPD